MTSFPRNDDVRIFVGDTAGPENFAAFFEERDDKGYLYVSDQKADKIVKHLLIYDNSNSAVLPEENDVKVIWSNDGNRCGVTIWGQMRGILDVVSDRSIVSKLTSHDSPGVADLDWLKGFDDYLNQEEFIRARQRYWKERVEGMNIVPLSAEQTPVQTNFIVYEPCSRKAFAVFEDEGETGYLYVYSPKEQTILRYLHVYDRSEQVNVTREDVQVAWSQDGLKCGVIIWEKMRGIIDLNKDYPGRVWLENRNTPGVDDPEWLSGF
jgi:hypothetical protein